MSSVSSIDAPHPRLRSRSNLTNGQLVIWTGQRRAGREACYANGLLTFIDGELDARRFEASFGRAVARHDALRTIIEERHGVPNQRVVPAAEIDASVPCIDLHTPTDPDAAARQWARDRLGRPHDLDRRLYDTVLLRIAPKRHAWFLNLHHVGFDGRAAELIHRDVAIAYNDADFVDAASASFAAYVAREHETPGEEEWQRSERHWQAVRARHYESPELYGTGADRRGETETWTRLDLGQERSRALCELAAAEPFRSLTLDMALAGIFATATFALVNRASRHSDVSVGLPFMNRRREWRDAVGLFLQLYPARVELVDTETFESLHAKVMQEMLDIRRHGAEGTGNSTHRATNDVVLNFLPMRFAPIGGRPSRTEFVPKTAADGSHCLMIQVHDLNDTGSFGLDVITNDGVIPAARQAALVDHLEATLDALLDAPAQEIRRAPLLTRRDERLLDEHLLGPTTAAPLDTPIDVLVAARAAEDGARVAVECGDEHLTYAALEGRANGVAHHLRAQGAGPGSIVGVYGERGIDLIVATLAVFKTGACYLPLDITYPRDRLEFILADSRAELLVTQSMMPVLESESLRSTIELDAVDPEASDDPPGHSASADDRAYVIYTSGSTGHPKGAPVSQRALVNVAWWQAHEASGVDRPRALQFSPLSFDVSLQEIFGTWLAGGTLVVPTVDVRRDPDALLDILISARVEQLYAIFTPLQQLAETVCRHERTPRSLREVFTCGEPVTITDALLSFFRRLPGCRFQNQYGSSEDLIVTSYILQGSSETWPTSPPIGRPLPHTRVYLLDDVDQPVLPGVPGEICISGAQVSPGYLHRPELTAERFFSGPAGAADSLFRTGDLARLDTDGQLQFLGRHDNQIKLRGFRVEPDEIEAALRAHPNITDAAVVARDDERGRRLVGYIVPSRGWADGSLDAVHESLRERLAPYMIPAAFVIIDALPTTPSGKTDRGALPSPTTERPEIGAAYSPPTDGLERTLTQLWAAALQIDRVGVHDDFFALGGDSLLALELAQTAGDRVDRILPLDAVFDSPTVAELAALIRDPDRQPPRLSQVRIAEGGTKAPLFFVGGRRLAGHLDPGRPFYSLHYRGLDGDRPEATVEEMATNYLAEIRAVQPEGPYLLGGACLGGQVAFEMARVLEASGKEVAPTLIVESFGPGIAGFRPAGLMPRLRRRAVMALAQVEGTRVGASLVDRVSRLYFANARTRPGADPKALQAVRRVERANIRATLAYHPQIFGGDIVLLRGRQASRHQPDLGWSAVVGGTVHVEEISGYHYSVLDEPHITALASVVDRRLEQLDL